MLVAAHARHARGMSTHNVTTRARWSRLFDLVNILLLSLTAAACALFATAALLLGGSLAGLAGTWGDLAWEMTLIVVVPAIGLAVLAVGALVELSRRPAIGRTLAAGIGVLAVGLGGRWATESGSALAATLGGLLVVVCAAAAWALESAR